MLPLRVYLYKDKFVDSFSGILDIVGFLRLNNLIDHRHSFLEFQRGRWRRVFVLRFHFKHQHRDWNFWNIYIYTHTYGHGENAMFRNCWFVQRVGVKGLSAGNTRRRRESVKARVTTGTHNFKIKGNGILFPINGKARFCRCQHNMYSYI